MRCGFHPFPRRLRAGLCGIVCLPHQDGLTARTERVSRLQAQVREQRDAIAVLRAEWARLDAPRRLQILAERHLKLKPIEASQFDFLKSLPERPPSLVPPGTSDPIGAMIEIINPDVITGSLPSQEAPQ